MDDTGRTPDVRSMQFLDEDAKRAILGGAMTILTEVGMVVQHPEAQALLAEAGCRVDGDGLALVPEHLVRSSLASAPAVVPLYDRDGKPAMELGGRRSYFGTGSDLMWTSDLETGERRRSTLEDVSRAARLVDRLPNMDFAMSSAYPNGVDPSEAYLRSFAAMTANTTKPLVAVTENGDDLGRIRDIAAVIRGGGEQLREKPYFAVYAEPVSPLQHPFDSIDKVLVSARAGLPCIYMPTPMTGATAPITIAGYMAQGTAEALFGLVVHQLCRPGAPFIYGHGHAVLDMQTAQSSYNAVDGILIELAMVEMAKWLDLPNFANSGTTDSQMVDAQAGMDIGAETLLMMQAGSNLNHDAGYLDFGLTASLETIVITDEAIALNRRLLGGLEVSRETLALEVIKSVGPGGHFLDQRHTRRHLRTSYWRPTILNRQGREAWVAEGGLDLRERARNKALDLLSRPETQPLAPSLAAAIEALVESFTGHNGDGPATRVAATPQSAATEDPVAVDPEPLS